MNNPDITVQWVSKFDEKIIDAIVSLVNCSTRDGGTLGYASPMAPDESERFVSSLQRRVMTGESHLLLGHVDSAPAFLAVLTPSGMQNCRHRAELGKGVVHPLFRGRRLVEIAFRQLVEHAESLGIEQFVLDVREGSRAHVLWQRFGFSTYGVLDDYARVNGIRHRGHHMVQSVASLRARLSMVENQLNQERERSHA